MKKTKTKIKRRASKKSAKTTARTTTLKPHFRLVDLIQKSAEWAKWRREGVGASDQLKIRSLKSSETVLRKKFGIYEPTKKYEEKKRLEMKATLLENDTKGFAAEWLARTHIKNTLGVETAPICIELVENPFFRASLDGYNDKFGPIEIKISKDEKTTHNFIHGGKKRKGPANERTGFGYLTDSWLYQCNWIMFLTDRESMRFFMCDELTMKFHERVIYRDPDIVKECIQNSARFQEFYNERLLPYSGEFVGHLIDQDETCDATSELKVGIF